MDWYKGTIPDAVNEAKRNNKLLLVYIEGFDEMSQNMSSSYDDPQVASKLSSENLIALKLIADSVPYKQFCAVYPVVVIPSSYFIAGRGSPVEIITGNLSPMELLRKLDNVFEAYEKLSGVKMTLASAPPCFNEESASPVAGEESVTTLPSEPSTSQIQARSIEDKVERAKALIEAQKVSKAEEEKELEKKREIERRSMGKAMQQAEKIKRDNEMKEWAKNRAKEKEEERLARERVKEMIAQDRAERAARFNMTKATDDVEKRRLALAREETERSLQNAAMSSTDARLQFRLPDGSHSVRCFSADATLEEARRFVVDEIRPSFSNFTLCTTFPRRHFSESDYPSTLRELNLAPSAVLLILPALPISTAGPGGFFSNIFWLITSPLWGIWNFVKSLFGGRQAQSHEPQTDAAANAQPSQPQSSGTTSSSSDNRDANIRRRDTSFTKREGNVFRINNQSDDDENNTWNGNSTQQM